MTLIRDWYNAIAGNNQLAMLLILLAAGTVFVVLTARTLAPFYAAVTIAYVLQVASDRLQRRGVKRGAALTIVFGIFVAGLLSLIGLVPLLGRQIAQFIGQLPQLVVRAQEIIDALPEQYPTLITPDQASGLMTEARHTVLTFSQTLAGYLGGTLIGIVTVLVYLVIVPIMVFFLLKDKDRIVAWLASLLPEHHELSSAVWKDVHQQLQNFVGGKVIQMLIVAVVSFTIFKLIHLNYAPLLAIIIGVAVLIPYVGAAFATIPVAVVAVLQWGLTLDAAIAIGAYGVIHALDGNVLVPLLFSEAVSIHPVAIIVAILFFGGIWGLWGVFFAIPLAVLVKAVITAWPTRMPAALPE
jgi:putative permease